MEYWEFEFCGKDSSDIQGTGLREEIREIAVKMGINGTVKNEKKNGKVKAVCLVENTEKALEFFSGIGELPYDPPLRLASPPTPPL